VYLSVAGDALTHDLAGIVDRERARKVNERSGVAYEIVEVLRLRALPQEGAPEVRIVRLDAKANNLAFVVDGVAAAGNARDSSGKGSVVQHAGPPRPEKSMDRAVLWRLRRADHF